MSELFNSKWLFNERDAQAISVDVESRYYMFWMGLFLGLVIGAMIGVATISIVSINKDYD